MVILVWRGVARKVSSTSALRLISPARPSKTFGPECPPNRPSGDKGAAVEESSKCSPLPGRARWILSDGGASPSPRPWRLGSLGFRQRRAWFEFDSQSIAAIRKLRRHLQSDRAR